MKNILSRLIKSYKDELEHEGSYNYVLDKLDDSDNLLSAVRRLDNEEVMYELSKAVLAIQIAENQLLIENEPHEVKNIIIEEKKYFQEHEVYDELMNAAYNRDRKALLKAVNKIPGEYSKQLDRLKYAFDGTYELTNLRLRGELDRVVEEYDDLWV